jgi:hypothetical protein
MKRLYLLVVTTMVLMVAAPVYAQDPDETDLNFYDQIVETLSPIEDDLADFAALVDSDAVSNTITSVWGVQLLSSGDTGQGVTEASPPGGYYPDAEEEVRQAGYTLENLSSRDISQMSVFDFVQWLAVTISLPFAFIRGLLDLTSVLGPVGLFISWLLLAVLWVVIVYFLSLLIPFARFVLELIDKIFSAIELFTP